MIQGGSTGCVGSREAAAACSSGAALCGFELKGAAQTLCDLAGGVGGISNNEFPEFNASQGQIEKKFIHAPAIGVTDHEEPPASAHLKRL